MKTRKMLATTCVAILAIMTFAINVYILVKPHYSWATPTWQLTQCSWSMPACTVSGYSCELDPENNCSALNCPPCF